MTQAFRDVRLPDDLCRAAEERFGSNFSCVEDLLIFILRELVRDNDTRLDKEEQEILSKRLRELGYI